MTESCASKGHPPTVVVDKPGDVYVTCECGGGMYRLEWVNQTEQEAAAKGMAEEFIRHAKDNIFMAQDYATVYGWFLGAIDEGAQLQRDGLIG